MAIKGAIPVAFGAVFPFGAFAKSMAPVADFEASKGVRQRFRRGQDDRVAGVGGLGGGR